MFVTAGPDRRFDTRTTGDERAMLMDSLGARRATRCVMSGQDAPPRFSDGAVPDPDVVAAPWETWGAEVAFADRFVAAAPGPDIVGEEYARHNGHAGLLRERIDGARGL
ncbi:DUF664 domain-containing protein [Streptomyces niveus]|uniref:Uncharacterized protein n=1 Tax=Streptomyces niveus TaxID=193462 RepID=A0A1U9QQH4_STRNV|nr:DUF664 domain-containing protein [Streptomyces niveus]AQU66420.1 hypothetical protein BBN63_09320 [Streptomyces niveus]